MNETDQTKVAYESTPKEVKKAKGLPSNDKQFGKGKMPQDEGSSIKRDVSKGKSKHVKPVVKNASRHKEHR